jgi:hypothetical protein
VTHIEKPLEENVNRLQVEGEEARSVEQAIAMLRYLLTNISIVIFNFTDLDIYLFVCFRVWLHALSTSYQCEQQS